MFFNKNKENERDNRKTHGTFVTILPKILSVFAAVVLWLYVIDVQTTVEETTVFGVPVTLENFDSSSGLSIISGKDYTVDIVIRGTKSDVSNVKRENVLASVDMRGIEKSDIYELDIDINVPKGITVVNTTASQVKVQVGKTINKTVPIDVVLNKSIEPELYEVGQEVLAFNEVQITGPQQIVDTIEKAEARIAISGYLRNKVNTDAQLVLIDKYGNTVESSYVQMNHTFVNVTIPVSKIETKQVVAEFADDGYIYEYSISPSEIKIKGDVTVVGSLDTIKTEPITQKQSGNVKVKLSLPRDVVSSDGIEFVTVKIKSVRQQNPIISNNEIEIQR